MKKRILSMILLLCMLITLFPTTAFAANSGTLRYDNNIRWSYVEASGNLRFSGSGRFSGKYADWETIRNELAGKTVKSITFGEGITDIGFSLDVPSTYGGFEGFLDSLETISLPSSLTSIGGGAADYANSFFYDCNALKEIIVSSGNRNYTSSNGVLYSKDKSVLLAYPVNKPGTNFSIPSGVKRIASAFWYCNNLTSISIPSSVTDISDESISFCHKLTAISVDPANRSYASADGVLFSKDMSKIVRFPEMKSSSYRIPDAVTVVDLNAFKTSYLGYDSSVDYLVLHKNVKEVVSLNGGAIPLIYYEGSEADWDKVAISYSGVYFDGEPRPELIVRFNSFLSPTGDITVTPDTTHYYYTPVKRQFQIYARGASYPAPVDFSITAAGTKYTGYSGVNAACDDIVVTVPKDYSGDLVVERTGYHTQRIPANLTGSFNYVVMTPDAVSEPFVESLLLDTSSPSYTNYTNLLKGSHTIYEKDLIGESKGETLILYPMVNWNGHSAGTVWLESQGVSIPLTCGQKNTVDLKNYFFTAHEDVYLCGKASDGTGFRTRVKLEVYKPRSGGINIDLGNSVQVNTAESSTEEMKLFSGESFEVDFSKLSNNKIPLEITMKPNGQFKGVIGIGIAGSNKEAALGSLKNSFARIKEGSADCNKEISKFLSDFKKDLVIGPQSCEIGVTGKAQFVGYFEGNWNNGHPTISNIDMVIIFTGSLFYTYNTVIYVPPAGAIPAYFKVELEAKMEEFVPNMMLDLNTGRLETKKQEKLNISISVSLEAGPGWEGYLSVGVKGKGTVKYSGLVPLRKETSSWSFQAFLYAVGTLAGVKGEWCLIETDEMVFWENGDFCWKEKNSSKSMMAENLYFVPLLSATNMTMRNTGNTIADGVNGYSAPTIAVLSDGRLLAVWAADVSGRSLVDNGGVYYSIFDGASWSDARLVYDDGTNDSVPMLHQANGVTYLAWQNFERVFNSSELPSYETIAAQNEVVVSAFDEASDTWGMATTETPNWYAQDELPEDYDDEWPASDSIRQVIAYGNRRAVIYTAPDASGDSQVWGLFYDGALWGEPMQLTEVSGGINACSAAFGAGGLNILYTTGEYTSSALMFAEVPFGSDISLDEADYVRETLSPGNELTFRVDARNTGLDSVNGIKISVLSSTGTELYVEDRPTIIPAGKQQFVYINYRLPEVLTEASYQIKIVPLSGADMNATDNTASCALELYDLAVENISAVYANNATQISVQIVNRGQADAVAAELVFFKNSLDGVSLATMNVPALSVGDTAIVNLVSHDLAVNDLVYAQIETVQEENIIGNNSLPAVVQDLEESGLVIVGSAVISNRNLTVDIRLKNRDTAPTEAANYILSAYDADGKQIGCQVFDNISIPASAETKLTSGFTVSSGAENVCWKLFVLNDQYTPISKPFSGTAMND